MGGISLIVILHDFFGHLEINGKSVKGFNRQAEVVFFSKPSIARAEMKIVLGLDRLVKN